MDPSLNVLVLARSHADFEQLERHLKLDGMPSTCRRVTSLEELKDAASANSWDAVLINETTAEPKLLDVVNVINADRPDVPMILISEDVGEQLANELVKAGAWDVVLKEDSRRLSRLVRRAIQDAERRRAATAAEQALRRSEERCRSVFASATDSLFVFLLGPDGRPGRFTEVNDAASQLLGYERAELLQLFPPDLVDATDRDRLPATFQTLLRDRHQHVELLLVAKDGRRIPVEISGSLFESEAHLSVLGIVRDITDRKQLENTLRAGQARLQHIVDTAQEGIWAIDVDNKTTFANAKMAALLGYTTEEMIGTSLFHFMDDEAKAIARLSMDRRQKGENELLEFRFRRKDGTPTWLLVNANPILSDDGTYIGALAMISDINERRRTEAEMRLQAAALSAAANAITITDRNGVVAWINPALTALTGYTADEVIGKNPRELFKSGAQDQTFYKHLWDTIQTGKAWRGEMTNRRKDGTLYSENLTITPVRNGPGGEITHFIAIKQDLTEEKRLQSQFLQAQKMESVGRLAGGIAHDFNNLLTVINGMAELASTNLKEGDPLHADLGEIRRAGERAAALTRQLLAFSRKQVMRPQVLSLSTLVADLRSLLQRIIGEDIMLVVAPTTSTSRVKADPGQIEQAIMNLVVNARDAMPNGGVLTIQTEDVEHCAACAAGMSSAYAGPYVLLSVSDTGTGMDDATRARLFEPFFTTKELGKGTGLGLATVYGIVEQSGGCTSVDTALGRGTTFKIYLPQVAEAAQASRPVVAAPVETATETILVVEDEDGVRHMAQRMLTTAGYTVLTARSGAEALLMLRRHQGIVDLMLTDVVMPELSGPDLAARAAEIRPEMKVLFTSGHTENAALRRSVCDNPAHFIGKPYTKTDLMHKVREALEAPPRAEGTMTSVPAMNGGRRHGVSVGR